MPRFMSSQLMKAESTSNVAKTENPRKGAFEGHSGSIGFFLARKEKKSLHTTNQKGLREKEDGEMSIEGG